MRDTDMHDKEASLLFLEIFVIVILLGLLSAIAVPYAGQMVNREKAEYREAELQDVRAAVMEMLCDSQTGMLVSAGPAQDISRIQTSDSPPLFLKDYWRSKGSIPDALSYAYSFSADGTVLQVKP